MGVSFPQVEDGYVVLETRFSQETMVSKHVSKCVNLEMQVKRVHLDHPE